MRITVALTALAASVLTTTVLGAASGFTVWTALGFSVVIILAVWIWTRLEAHMGEAARSRDYNRLRGRMFDVVRRGRAVADRYEEIGLNAEATAARIVADELDGELQ
jgi:membrane protein implicated in regulation of membrane protease activity